MTRARTATLLALTPLALAACSATPSPQPGPPRPSPTATLVSTASQTASPSTSTSSTGEPAVSTTAPPPAPTVAATPLEAPPYRESVEAKGSVAQLRAQVGRSQHQWSALLSQHGGRYTYGTGFQSWVGFGHETVASIDSGKIVAQSYRSYDQDRKTRELWVERGTEVGSHGSVPSTFEELYEQCLDEVLTKDPATHAFHVSFYADGVLAHCTVRHRQCADDCSEGVSISGLAWR